MTATPDFSIRMQVAGMRGLLSEIIAVGALSKHGDTDLMERVREAADTPLPELPTRSCLAQIEEPAGAAPAAVAPFGYVNTYTGQFLFDVEPCRKDNEGHWRTVYLQPAAVAPQGGYPPLPEPVADWVQRGSVSIGGGSLDHEISREVVFTAAQMRAYFDLGRQPAAAPALEAPAAPAVPAGFALVPIEPTQQMLDAGRWSGAGSVSIQEEWARKEVWSRMLATVTPPPAAYADDLVALVTELVQALRKATPDNDLAGHALDYLKRNGLQESPLRAADTAPQAPAAPVHSKTYSDGTVATGSGELPAQSPQQQVLCTLLDTVEAMLGGANGPTIQIRAALLAAPAAPALSAAPIPVMPRAITAGLGLDDSGEEPAYCVMVAFRQEDDARYTLSILSAGLGATAAPAAGNWIAAEEVDRLVRDLDVALHGEADAAPQASLCDIVGLAKAAAGKLGRPVLAAPAAPAVDATSDTALLDAMQRHRIALVPEFEGPWDAEIFNDEAEAPLIASGNTPREALHAALAAQAKEGGEPA